ncbi:CidA/LrgA family protein [Alsobacter soli]|uniref:CidA/LrgA family protein n=1 Tax=Alsobacter soli TaxID=2109933 RepID=A0A2T1HLC0_9HYPH|nr:CidA/LrgA family protein [Alsobacter soli]PSC02432.1 CidA/LrgA family protein [Alsobacter soli]
MIPALTLLLACQLAGEATVRLAGWPVPGPVLGMALLVAILLGRDRLRPGAAPVSDTPLGAVTRVMLANLSLLFVPAGVGILRNAPALASNGLGLATALVVSTLLTLLVTALVFRALSGRLDGSGEPNP